MNPAQDMYQFVNGYILNTTNLKIATGLFAIGGGVLLYKSYRMMKEIFHNPKNQNTNTVNFSDLEKKLNNNV